MSDTDTGAAEFRAFLAERGETQSSFARRMRRLGDDRSVPNILRAISRTCTGQIRLSGEMRVIMTLLRHLPSATTSESRLAEARSAANTAKTAS